MPSLIGFENIVGGQSYEARARFVAETRPFITGFSPGYWIVIMFVRVSFTLPPMTGAAAKV